MWAGKTAAQVSTHPANLQHSLQIHTLVVESFALDCIFHNNLGNNLSLLVMSIPPGIARITGRGVVGGVGGPPERATGLCPAVDVPGLRVDL